MSQRRSVSFALACAALSVVPCSAQTQATFHTQSQQIANNGNRLGGNLIAIDVNNDGTPDLVEIGGSPSPVVAIQIYLAKGDGTFTAGAYYTFSSPSNQSTAYPAVWGDFNGDGKVDLVLSLGATNQIAVLLGNGNGTFQAPVFETIALPSGTTFASNRLATADFNRDGKLDLIAVGQQTTGYQTTVQSLYLISGNGNGTFGTPQRIYTGATNDPLAVEMKTGDFDGDTNADVAFLDQSNCNVGGECTTALHVLFGAGNGTFTDTTPYISSTSFIFGAGDVNSDGKTDLFGVLGNSMPQHLVVWYGESSRTFAQYTQTVNGDPTTFVGFFNLQNGFTLADMNGDGHMDIVALTGSTTPHATQIRLFLGTSSPGAFTEEDVNAPYSDTLSAVPVVGVFNKDAYNRPSIAYGGETDTTSSTMVALAEAINTTNGGFWGGCAFPASGKGISLCSPSSVAANGPLTFDAAANSFGNLRKMELWVDGKKLGEQYHAWGQRAWFDMGNVTAAPGSHTAALFAVDIDNKLQSLSYNFNVVNCTAPASPGINVCSPLKGSTVNSPVSAVAAATVPGTIQRMEVWVDYAKKYSTSGSNALSVAIPLAAGAHRFDFFAVNTAGQKYQATEYVTTR